LRDDAQRVGRARAVRGRELARRAWHTGARRQRKTLRGVLARRTRSAWLEAERHRAAKLTWQRAQRFDAELLTHHFGEQRAEWLRSYEQIERSKSAA